MFSYTSRYGGLPSKTYRLPDGRVIVYVAQRVVPKPESLAEIGRHRVRPGEHLDLIAATELGDPELAWQLADANRAMDPAELTEVVGRLLRVTLPAGLPGPAPSSGAGNG
ncbi:hypothetical protein M6D93_17725 [Jatrophihabitans telluris]|uniref:LysM domain-containing protein n=1 Tax=Jatrophihabitans telluris TaxID=2038343 RepID=A0ABY4QXW8_9ACTN|nr:hypothetical protein [Jatrophihabitans telluris]UQX88112.1 hypothetical protein M6D93_17725 [Jatrophihabitans telluris]